MADLIRALEADLFGAYEWAADMYAELAAVKEPVERLLVLQGLFRAFEALERPADATAAAERMVAAEDDVPAEVRERLAPVTAAREALLDADDPAEQAERLAPAFLQAFRAAWDEGPREPLVADALLAALAQANLIATRGHSVPGETRASDAPYHRDAATLYAAVADLLESRVRAGESAWRDTARSAWHRAMIAWRVIGDEDSATRAEAQARGLGAGAGTYV